MMRSIKYILFFIFCTCINIYAQTPYDAFAPEVSRPILDVVQNMVANNDSLQQTQMDTTLATKNDVSKWLSPDPLSDKYPEISPYAYCGWNPVKYIDPDGRDVTLAGANRSSVTIRTDLINLNVNISNLNVDFGGTYNFQGDEILSASLDIAGIFDPLGVADGLNAVLQWDNGDVSGAVISAAGLFPYVGDLAKAGKVKKDLGVINNAIDAVQSKGTQKSLNQLQREIFTGKAPKGITRLDKGELKHNEQPHMHFKDGSALNKDGTWKHGKGKLTNEQLQYLKQNGWNVEQ